MATVKGIKKILEEKEFTYLDNSSKFLPESQKASVDMTPYILGDAKNIRGFSFFAALKAMDMTDEPWYVEYLRLPGKSNITNVNPDTQKVVLAILHGLHAYFVSMDETAPSLRTPLPIRFRYVLGKFDNLNVKDMTQVDRIFNIMKRQYLNQPEMDEGELQIRDLMPALKTPVNFIKNPYFKQPTGETPVAIEADSGDTETVRDIYVARIPLATVVLGRRHR